MTKYGTEQTMTDRKSVGGLQVAKVLYDFVQNEALPGTGVDSRSVLGWRRNGDDRSGTEEQGAPGGV